METLRAFAGSDDMDDGDPHETMTSDPARLNAVSNNFIATLCKKLVSVSNSGPVSLNLGGERDVYGREPKASIMPRTLSPLRMAALAVALVAPLYVVIATLRREVNVPFWDEWEWADLAFRIRTGAFAPALLWAPHNGHRNVIPNAIFLAIDHWIGWSPRFEEYVGIMALLVGQFALWFLVERSVRRGRVAVYAILSVLLYNPAQYESLSMGFNLGWEICTAASIVLVERLTSRSLSLVVVGQAALIAMVASLTSGQGLLLWPIGAAMLAVRRARVAAIVVWITIAIVTYGAYFRDDGITGSAGTRPGLIGLGEYVIVFFGNGFAHRQGVGSSALWGSLIIVSTLAVLVIRLRTTSASGATTELLPWAAFGAYSVLCAFATAMTRANLGVVEATSSRYSAMSMFLVFALVGLSAAVLTDVRLRGLRLGAGAVAVVLVFGFAQSAVWSDATWRYWEARRSEAAQRIAAGDFSEFDRLYPDEGHFRQLLGEVCRIGDSPIRCPPADAIAR